MSEDTRQALHAQIAALQLAGLGDVAQAFIKLCVREAYEEGYSSGAARFGHELGREFPDPNKILAGAWNTSESRGGMDKIFKMPPS